MTNTRFFVDENGRIIGGFGDGAQPPAGAIEVSGPPPVDDAVWGGSEWIMPPAPVPASLSFAQLLIGLVSEQWITVEEGRAWRDRTGLPAQVQAVISLLPKEHQFAAETRALAPSEVLRSDPLVAAMGMAAGKTEEEMDEFFRKYAVV